MRGTRHGAAWFAGTSALLAAGIAVTLIPSLHAAMRTATDDALRRIVAQKIQPLIPTDGAGGAAVALRIRGRTLFLNTGWADLAEKRPITSDSLFNLASI